MPRNLKRSQSERRYSWPLAVLGCGLVLVAALGLMVLFTPMGGKVKRGLQEIFRPDPVIVRKEAPVPARAEGEHLSPLERDPDPDFPTGLLTPPRGMDIRRLSKGIDLRVTFDASEGGPASLERKSEEAYTADYALKVRMPRASTSWEELAMVSPHLLDLLPGLEKMLPHAKVSAWYGQLYANKAARLKASVGKLDEVLTRHNFYDCETILNLRSPETGQRLFLLQAEMDVVSDGSDGDRLATMPGEIVNSTNYQPFTSYRWRKKGTVPNPMIEGWEKRIGKARSEIGESNTTEDRKTWLQGRIKMLQTGIADMKYASFLIAEYDPFVVIPANILTDRQDPYAPNVGDFAIVVYGRRLFPAIVGDAGPSFKVGEASLRMAREINPDASPYRRPVSDLTVTYLVFPRTADDPKGAPDYGHWGKRCAELVEAVGGLGPGAELHEWKDLLSGE